MAHRRTNLALRHQDLAVDADVRAAKLSPTPVEDRPELVHRDARTGEPVERRAYDPATGEPLPEGYAFRWETPDGRSVPDEQVELYAVWNGEPEPVALREPTVGAGRTLSPVTWIPVATVDEYLVDRVYELYGETRADEAELFELALHVRDVGEAPVLPFVLQPSPHRSWGIVTPAFFGDTFSLIVRVTDRRIEPEHAMPVFTPAERSEAAEAAGGRSGYVEYPSPFG